MSQNDPTSLVTVRANGVTCDLCQLDAVAWLNSLPGESVDLAITDPAYESLEKHRNHGTTVRLRAWFDIFPNARFEDLFRALYRVLRPNTHLYVMCDDETAMLLVPIGRKHGFTYWKRLVWDKVSIGMGYHYRARHEYILFFEKGKRRLASLSVPDVLPHKRERACRYPTAKPVDLLKVLVEQSSVAGELVIDPFMGSGSTAAAAVQLGRRFAGCDTSPEAMRATLDRVAVVGP